MVSINSKLDISLDSSLGSIAEFKDEIQIALKENDEKHETKGSVHKIINIYLRHNLTLVCLEDFMEIFNDCREDCVKFPTNKKQIIELFHEHRDLVDIFYLIDCDKCQFSNNIDSKSKTCAKCIKCGTALKPKETNFFISIPIEEQIVRSLKKNWSYIKAFDTSSENSEKFYSDAHDGEILRDLLKEYKDSNVNILSLCVNTDGANKFKSNVLSVWPIQLTQNYLPPSIRFLQNIIIVAGLYYNEDKPNFRKYFLPLIDELKVLKDRNILMDIENDNYIFKPVITHGSFDLPAKSLVQETKQYGGYDSCTFCEIPGELIEIKKSDEKMEMKNKKNKNKKSQIKKKQNTENKDAPNKFIRYVERDEPYPLRDLTKTLETMLVMATSSNKKAIDGIKDVSCLVGLEHFNFLFSVSVEYMHSGLLGASKRLLNFFCSPKYKNKNFYIAPKNRKILNRRILALKPTSNIVRKPRSLEQHIYVQHVRLLSAAIYILLKEKIPTEDVEKADEMLNRFVKQHQELFGKESMVMVIHLLKHFAESVRKLGPLWCHSAFPFERNNGCLLKMVRGTTDVLHQISTKYALWKSLCENPEPSIKKVDDNKIFQGRGIDIMEKCLKVESTDTAEKFDFSNITLRAYKRIKLGKTIFTSLLYTRPKKSIDYFIGLKNEMVGTAKFYFEHNSKTYAMVEEYEIIDNIYHIMKVRKTKRILMVPIGDILQKYIFIKVGINQYIVSPPNSYENE